jgi:hypothetical protein
MLLNVIYFFVNINKRVGIEDFFCILFKNQKIDTK